MIGFMRGGSEDQMFVRDRQRMLKWDLKGRDITDPAVLRVMDEVPREEFVPAPERYRAYADNPLSIGCGQTISQPYIVALMTQELKLNRGCEVLEIGTGSGYQTVILSRLCKKVYTIEREQELSSRAKQTLDALGVSSVEFYVGDGSCGWPEEREFDRVLVTAAVPELPEPLVRQLCDGGVIVAPVGSGGLQQLLACVKKGGRIHKRAVCDCRFVRLLGKYGFEE